MRSFREDCCHSIGVVGGEPCHSKITAKPDVVRLVHGPDMHLVAPLEGPFDELGIFLDQRQIWSYNAYAVRQPAVAPPAKIIFDHQSPFQSG